MEYLSLVSTTKDVVVGCVKALHLVKESLRLGQAATKLQIKLQDCHIRLCAWIVVYGWPGADKSSETDTLENRSFLDANDKMILVALAGIERSYEKIQNLAKRYEMPLVLPDFDALGPVIDGSDVAPSGRRLTIADIREQQKASQRELRRKIPASDIRRYIFAVADNKRLEKLVDDISGAIFILERLLDTQRRIEYTAMFDLDAYEKLQNKSFAELVNLQQEARDAGDQRVELATNVSMATQSAATELAHHQRASQGLGEPWPFKSLLGCGIEISDDRDKFGRATANLLLESGAQRVLIEFKEKWLQDGSELTQQDDVDYLCNMLSTTGSDKPVGLRTLQGLGHLDDEAFKDHFLLAFALPSHPIEPDPIISLYEVLNTKMYQHTPLEERLALALSVARSIQHFFMFGWLHKGIRSPNIIFLKGGKQKGSSLSTAPFSLGHHYVVGFDNGRREAASNLTNTVARPDRLLDLYRHPHFEGGVTSHGAGYSAQYDLYSLGVVLCEIAQWVSVDAGAFVNQGSTVQHRLRPSELAKVFTQGEGDRFWTFSPLRGMAHRMGSSYLRAVQSCFVVDDGSANLAWVSDHVVGPLERAVVGDDTAVL
jgi:hypothetical protein